MKQKTQRLHEDTRPASTHVDQDGLRALPETMSEPQVSMRARRGERWSTRNEAGSGLATTNSASVHRCSQFRHSLTIFLCTSAALGTTRKKSIYPVISLDRTRVMPPKPALGAKTPPQKFSTSSFACYILFLAQMKCIFFHAPILRRVDASRWRLTGTRCGNFRPAFLASSNVYASCCGCFAVQAQPQAGWSFQLVACKGRNTQRVWFI